MKMKKIWVALLLAGMSFGMGSCMKEDIDDIRKELQEHDDRLTSLEEWQKSVNTDISSLQSLVEALEDKDYVTGVTPLADGSGYEISFLKSGKITIKHGEKGDDGDTPVISVKQDTDGKYYWTVNGEWLLDGGNNKMPVTGENGDDGETPYIGNNGNWWVGTTDTGVKAQGNTGDDGLTPHIGDNGNWWIGTTDTGVKAQGEQGDPGTSAIAPQVRINTDTNEWEISTDGGKTWASTGVTATGEKGADGDSFFKDVTVFEENGYVSIELDDGQKFQIPLLQNRLIFAQGGTALTDLTQTLDITQGDLTYTASQGTTVSARMLEGENWKASVVVDKQLISLLPGSLKEEALLEVTLTENAKVLETYRLTVMQSGLRGSGTDEEDPYLISSPAELAYIAETVNDGTPYDGEYFKLTQDIDLTGVEWTPIGLYNGKDLVGINFEGIFDGGGYTIKGLTIQDKETDLAQGLFGSVVEGEIKHLTLELPAVAGKFIAGGIAGTIWNLTIVEDCHVKGGTFCAYNEVGSIVGLNDGSTIQNCSAESTTVTVEGAAGGGGGIAGNMTSENTDANVIACRFSGNVRTNYDYGRIGGIVGGTQHGYCYINACYANCILTVEGLGGKKSDNRVGGVAATLQGYMTGCYAVVEVEGENLAAVGGVVGYLVTEGYGDDTFDYSANACYWSAEGDNVSFGTGGSGFINNNNSEGATNEGTIQVSGSDWSTAKEAMNAVLSGTGWQYKENTGSDKTVFPLIVEKV